MKDWMKLIPAIELANYEKAGFSGDLPMGKSPALIVVDVTLGFTGSEGLTLAQAMAEFSTACGPSSWIAMPKIARLIAMFRTRGAPVTFTRTSDGRHAIHRPRDEVEAVEACAGPVSMIFPPPWPRARASGCWRRPRPAPFSARRCRPASPLSTSTQRCCAASPLRAVSGPAWWMPSATASRHLSSTTAASTARSSPTPPTCSTCTAKYATVMSLAEIEPLITPADPPRRRANSR